MFCEVRVVGETAGYSVASRLGGLLVVGERTRFAMLFPGVNDQSCEGWAGRHFVGDDGGEGCGRSNVGEDVKFVERRGLRTTWQDTEIDCRIGNWRLAARTASSSEVAK